MPSRPKCSTNPMKTDKTTSKKRPLSPNATSSIARRPSTQCGFVLSSGEDDESTDDEYKCHFVASNPVGQQAVAPSKAPASLQEPLPVEPTKGLFPTKQVNKARLNALLGRNGKPKQPTRKALPSSPATQSPQRSVDPAGSNELAESSNIPQKNAVPFTNSSQTSLPKGFGKSLLGVKRTAATHPQLLYAANSVTVLQNNFLQQHKSTYELGNTAPIKGSDGTKDKETALTVRPCAGIDKEKGQRKFLPTLKPVAKQAPIKLHSDSRSANVHSMASSGRNLGTKAQELPKSEPKILQSQSRHKENESKCKQQASEVHGICMGSTESDSSSFKQPLQKDAGGANSDGANSITVAALQKPIQDLPRAPMSPKIEQENLKSKGVDIKSSKKASGAEPAALSSPVTLNVTPGGVPDANNKILVLPRHELSKEVQPYFEYSVFRRDWSSEQDEQEASTEEIILHRFTNMLEANKQAEKLFQSEKHSSYMIVECSTKRDEHGCIVLSSSIAPFDHPVLKHHTKIYVRRDYVSKFANQTPQSLMSTSFISSTGYVLRLFKLIEVSDSVNSGSSDSDSDSPVAVASDPIRAYHANDRPEVYTTLEAANRAAINLQVQLSHEKDPKDAMTKAFQEQDLKKLNAKVRELETARDGADRCWRSKFNASGLGGDKLELVVEKVGICGPRNI